MTRSGNDVSTLEIGALRVEVNVFATVVCEQPDRTSGHLTDVQSSGAKEIERRKFITMDDSITKTIEKLQDVGPSVKDTSLFHKVDYTDDASVLELEKRARSKKQRSLEAKRNDAIKMLNEKGFPSIRPTLSMMDDFESLCPHSTLDARVNQRTRKPIYQVVQPLPEKPQNRSPHDINSYRGDKFNAPPETRKYAIPINEPFVSDRLIRARERARLSNFEETSTKHTALSNVFPQMAVQDSKEITGVDELARKYLFSSVYQTTYGNPFNGTKNGGLHRRIYPLQTLQTLPDPLKSVSGFSACHPATSTWQVKQLYTCLGLSEYSIYFYVYHIEVTMFLYLLGYPGQTTCV
ncbi:hypothetical protein P879_05238 [Paragonimus westermani]|uniref:Uncharacterized protein n=1 Tax=Paragonimus westermani TaxID=34504 RepID=A0A8T0DSU6_9TREM|nr:hypothetical protein P879_05238 [Paragonimus westermani]